MSYDSPDFRVQMMHGPIFGSFSATIVTGASSETKTSEDSRDRHEFFRNVKLLGFKVLPKVACTSGNAAYTHNTIRAQLKVGADVVATAIILGSSTDVDSIIDGGIASGSLAEVTSNEAVSLALGITGDGTTETFTANSVEAYVLYEHRFA